MMLHDPDQNPQTANAMMKAAYLKMHQALVHTHRPIVYSLCQYGVGSVWEWAPSVGANLWRTTDDIRDNYRSMALIGFSQAGFEKFAGPGHWNDPDMLEIGNGGMNADQYRTQMSLWAILAAPLLAGNDLSKMDEMTRSILLNKEVIAVDQDALGVQGHRVGPPQVWVKPLSAGATAVAIFNYVTDDEAEPLTLELKDFGFTVPFTRGIFGPIRILEFCAAPTRSLYPRAEWSCFACGLIQSRRIADKVSEPSHRTPRCGQLSSCACARLNATLAHANARISRHRDYVFSVMDARSSG
jgi:Alpha galactosidase A/Alpha galactosidase C-terminal beta sandwich domain